MEVIHEAQLKPWARVGAEFDQHGAFGKKFWRQHFRNPKTGDENEFVFFAQKDWSVTLPILDNGDLVLVQEWKQGCESICTGFPAGTVEPGESLIRTGERETGEETGLVVDEIEPLGSAYIATRSSPTQYHMFVAWCHISEKPQLDPGENIRVIRVTQHEFWKMVHDEKIGGGCSIDLAARAAMYSKYLDLDAFAQFRKD